MRKIFISYRRSEAAFPAGALGRDLRRRFGDSRVFRDREDIGGGAMWRQKILSEIDHDAVLLVLIGPHWLTPAAGKDQSRLHDPNDTVRMEIADGIRDGATLIPVLLDGAPMPAAEQLPENLRVLCEVNALQLRDADWQHDVERICETLERSGFDVEQRGSIAPAEPRGARRTGTSSKTVIAVMLVVMSAVVTLTQPYDTDSKEGILGLSGLAIALAIWAMFDGQYRDKRHTWLNAGATVFSLLFVLMALVRVAAPVVTDRSAATDPQRQEEPR